MTKKPIICSSTFFLQLPGFLNAVLPLLSHTFWGKNWYEMWSIFCQLDTYVRTYSRTWKMFRQKLLATFWKDLGAKPLCALCAAPSGLVANFCKEEMSLEYCVVEICVFSNFLLLCADCWTKNSTRSSPSWCSRFWRTQHWLLPSN